MSYKIYVHHNYTYELFWYFFHGVDVDMDDIIVHTNIQNAFNKKIPIQEHIKIKCNYQGKELDITFCGDDCWKKNGEHILDYSIYLLQKNLTSDRGYNTLINKVIDNKLIPFFNKISMASKRIHFFHLDWEGHNPYYHHKMDKLMDKSIQVYLDEMESEYESKKYKNKHFVFTNTFMSFIYPNTLGLREFIYFGDILKYKNDYKYKLNFPIRRIYGHKLKIYNKIKSLKNSKINITNSSFHDTSQYSLDNVSHIRNKMINEIGEENIIEKRGYGINDWGGEWNDSNVKEMMWRLMDISEVNILPEYFPNEAYENIKSHENPLLIGNSFVTEKSISHILCKKPFIPSYYGTIEFYNSILINNGYDVVDFPIKYNSIIDIIEDINNIASDDLEWNSFKDKLTKWVNNTHYSLKKIVNTKNDYLDILLSLPKLNESSINKNVI